MARACAVHHISAKKADAVDLEFTQRLGLWTIHQFRSWASDLEWKVRESQGLEVTNSMTTNTWKGCCFCECTAKASKASSSLSLQRRGSSLCASGMVNDGAMCCTLKLKHSLEKHDEPLWCCKKKWLESRPYSRGRSATIDLRQNLRKQMKCRQFVLRSTFKAYALPRATALVSVEDAQSSAGRSAW